MTVCTGVLHAATTVSNPMPTPNNTSQLDQAQDGTYTVTIMNTSTACDFTTTYDLSLDLAISLPNIVDVQTIDPKDCNPTGEAEVASVAVGSGVPVVGALALAAAFDFEWYNGDFLPANLRTETTVMVPALVTDPGFLPGSYNVRVIDKVTKCPSGPIGFVITPDDIEYPHVTINQTALQIVCDPLLTTAVNSPEGVSNGSQTICRAV